MSDLLDRLSALSGRIGAESTLSRLREDNASNPEILMYLEAELATLTRYTERIRHQIGMLQRDIETDERMGRVVSDERLGKAAS